MTSYNHSYNKYGRSYGGLGTSSNPGISNRSRGARSVGQFELYLIGEGDARTKSNSPRANASDASDELILDREGIMKTTRVNIDHSFSGSVRREC